MNFAKAYLNTRTFISQQIAEPPSGLLHFIVVIPAYLEDKIYGTLNALLAASNPATHVEIIIVINHSEADLPENKKQNHTIFLELDPWCREHSEGNFRFYGLYTPDLPKKHAGAGLARKIGMDEAVRRFNAINRPDGLILSLDADSIVDNNYFTETERVMTANAASEGCLFYFEHPLSGKEFSDDIYNAVMQYELHLRYYRFALEFIGYPFYYYTIGSCFGVRASVYVAQSGMNRRQAGEDFYFLHKLFPNRRFTTITGTCVHPSPRPSFRVPFGTGPVISRLISGEKDLYTYHPKAFDDLQKFIILVPSLYRKKSFADTVVPLLPDSVTTFLTEAGTAEKLDEIKRNTSTPEAFIKRFFQWFDGFMVVKFLNYAHTHFYSKIPVIQAVRLLLTSRDIMADDLSEKELLVLFRKADKEGKSLGA